MRARWERLLDRSELPMLGLAGIAVAGYLMELAGLWARWDLMLPYQFGALFIDLVFLVDLAVKLVVLGRSYLLGPWFLVDLICTLPILSTLAVAPGALQGLRSVRMFRVLRALRLLRIFRSLRILRVIGATTETREDRAFHRVLGGAVVAYAVLFVLVVAAVRSSAPPGRVVAVDGRPVPSELQVDVVAADGSATRVAIPARRLFMNPDRQELSLVFGSLLGMLLIAVVARFQIPALWSRQVRAFLSVALPSQVAEHFMEHPESYDNNVRMPATVIFCDIKGFTSTVEVLALDELKGQLEHALDAVVEAHLRHDLIIDKFIGDAVMSFRGGNLVDGDPSDHAYRVVRGALDGAIALAELGNPHFKVVKTGGASASDALIGTFGASRRLSYTILGDRVNLAARLEGSCNALGVANLFCSQTQALTGQYGDIVWRRVGRLKVQGRYEATTAYEAHDSGSDTRWVAIFHRALERYEEQQFADAKQLFESVDEQRPGGDALSTKYVAWCAELLASPPGPDWTPVLTTTK